MLRLTRTRLKTNFSTPQRLKVSIATRIVPHSSTHSLTLVLTFMESSSQLQHRLWLCGTGVILLSFCRTKEAWSSLCWVLQLLWWKDTQFLYRGNSRLSSCIYTRVGEGPTDTLIAAIIINPALNLHFSLLNRPKALKHKPVRSSQNSTRPS